jgi:hypothetical protein
MRGYRRSVRAEELVSGCRGRRPLAAVQHEELALSPGLSLPNGLWRGVALRQSDEAEAAPTDAGGDRLHDVEGKLYRRGRIDGIAAQPQYLSAGLGSEAM